MTVLSASQLGADAAFDEGDFVIVGSADGYRRMGRPALLGNGVICLLEDFGGGVDKTGAQNSTAIQEAFASLTAANGGTIKLAAGEYAFDPTTIPASDKTVLLQGIPFATKFIPTEHSTAGGYTRQWMLEFGDKDNDTAVQFHGIRVNAPTNSRVKFNGIRIHRTNQCPITRCQGFHCDGTPIQVDRVFNTEIGLFTYNSGSAEDGLPSFLLTGSLGAFGSDPDHVTNDVYISPYSATEIDDLGWWIEHTTNIREGSGLKVHGPGSGPALTLLQVTAGHLAVMPTNNFSHEDQIVVADAGAGVTAKVNVTSSLTNSDVTLSVQTARKHNYTGTLTDAGDSDVGRIFTVKQAQAGSYVQIKNRAQGVEATNGGDVYYVKTDSPGTAGATLDLSEFKVEDADRSLVVYGEDSTATRVISPEAGGTTIRAFRAGVVSTSDTIAIPPQAIKPGQALILKRVEVSAKADTLPFAYDASDHWTLVLTRLTVDQETLILARETLSSTPGDGFPDSAGGTPSTTGTFAVYEQGLAQTLYGGNTFVSARLVKVGSPPNLEDVSVALTFG